MKIGLFLGYVALVGAIAFFSGERLTFATGAASEISPAVIESAAAGVGHYLAIAVSLIPIVLLYGSLEKRKADTRQ